MSETLEMTFRSYNPKKYLYLKRKPPVEAIQAKLPATWRIPNSLSYYEEAARFQTVDVPDGHWICLNKIGQFYMVDPKTFASCYFEVKDESGV